MGKKKLRKMEESDSELEFNNDADDGIAHGDNYHDDPNGDTHYNYEDEDGLEEDDYDDEENKMIEDEDEDDDEVEEEEEEEEEEEDSANENEDERVGEEMEELEKEYRELKNEEQDLLRNLKRNKDEDLQKGQALKSQRALWDKALEFRFLLQKAFYSSNRLPQEPVRTLFCNTDNKVTEAYSDLLASTKKTLDSILELQQALLENNPSVTQPAEDSKQLKASGNSSGDDADEWLQISQMQSRITSFRNKSIDKWQRKTQMTTGAAAIKDKLHAFNQSISQQVAAYMWDPSKMIKGMQQNRSAVAVFGNVPDSADNNKQEETSTNDDPELLDDSEFYQQLLKEFFETIDPSSSETALYALKRLQTKKRKIVDRRASKSRKLRYHVHEKIVNFVAPRPMDLPPMASKLFENLFDLKTKKSTAVA